MATASRSLATALLRARVASGLLPQSYTTTGDTTVGHRQITLTVRPGFSSEAKAEVLHGWHKSLLHAVVPELIRKWEPRLAVKVSAYFLQRMKTKWGSCNYRAGNIRLNTELVSKPKDLLEYVVVHEMAHLLEPTHNERFISILDQHYPSWRDARAELNDLPLAAEKWNEQMLNH